MITIIAVLLACTASAQNKWITGHAPARNRISESTIMEKVEYLTNDICEGRGTGTRGSVEVAGWIARNFEKIKLLKNNGNYYQRFAGERINQMAITAGVGFPVKMWGSSSINLGFEYGRMSSAAAAKINNAKVGLVTQNYYKISVGFTLFSLDTSDYWFVRQKYD
jgi:hypothetical protein